MKMTIGRKELKVAVALYVLRKYGVEAKWVQWNVEQASTVLKDISVTVGTDNDE